MAQGRRFTEQNRVAGDYSHNDFWGRKSVLEVGGAYLFEKPRSGVRKMPRFPDSTDATTDDVSCDSGAYYSDDAHRKPKKADDDHSDDNAQCDNDVYYTSYTDDARYEPNTSRRRRPHAGDPTTIQSHAESIRPVRKLGND
jgi:hypothetical protein